MMTNKFLDSFAIAYTVKDFKSVEAYETFKLESWNRYQQAVKFNEDNPIAPRRSKV